jgi:hypothetical protein
VAGNEQTRIEFHTVKRRKVYSQGLTPYFRTLPIRNIAEQDRDRWVKERGAALASETFVHKLDVMKTVFEFGLERGLILSNPAKHIKRRKVISKQIVVPSLAQFEQLVSAIRLSEGKKDNQKKSKDGGGGFSYHIRLACEPEVNRDHCGKALHQNTA